MEESAVLGPRLEAATSLGEDYAVEPFGLSWRSHTLFIISTVIIGLFSETFLYGIVVPVLPFILQDRLGVIHDELQGYSSALLAVFAVSSAICAPFVGALADRFQSRKTPLMIGLAILIAVCFAISTPRARPLLTGSGYDFVFRRSLRFCPGRSEMYAGRQLCSRLDSGICFMF